MTSEPAGIFEIALEDRRVEDRALIGALVAPRGARTSIDRLSCAITPAHIAGIDLFVVPTVGFKLLYGLVILRMERRRLVWTNVTANPTAEWIARQITEAFPWDEAPLPHP